MSNFPVSTNQKTQNFIQGIQLILKYQPDAEIQAWEDVGISCGIYTEGINKVTGITKKEIEQLNNWGMVRSCR